MVQFAVNTCVVPDTMFADAGEILHDGTATELTISVTDTGLPEPLALNAVTDTVCEPAARPLKVSLDVGPAPPTDQRFPSTLH